MNIENIKKKIKNEDLRKPQARDKEVFVSYGPATTPEEDLGRTIKTQIIPKLSELIKEVEWCYNGHTWGSYEKEKDAKEREKLLKPLENLYNCLKKEDENLVKYLNDLK